MNELNLIFVVTSFLMIMLTILVMFIVNYDGYWHVNKL